MKPWIEGEDAYRIYQELKTRGGVTFPESKDTWQAFRWTNYENLKAIFVGLCPYHTAYNGKCVADGMAFSCSKTMKESPSMEVLYDAMRDDLSVRINRNPDWHYIAFQDVLLLNASLTTKKGIVDSDNVLWQPLMEYLWAQVFDTVTGVPIVLFGAVAKETVAPHLSDAHPWKYVKHPSFWARKHLPMEHDGFYSWINEICRTNNREQVYWNYDDWEREGLPF